MGITTSKRKEATVSDFGEASLPYSYDKKLSNWELRDKPKNFEYYFTSDRCTKISRKLYPRCYTKGWLYDYYYHFDREFDGEEREF